GDAITAVLEDRPVRADLALREHLLGGSANTTPYDMVRSKFEPTPVTPRVPERTGVEPARTVEQPHPMPDQTGSSVPLLARNGELQLFTGRKTAENAVRRIHREQGYRPEIVETPEGFILSRESTMEPVRRQDGSVMDFANERQALRYVDDQNLLHGPDIDPVTGTGREYQVIKYHDGSDGPVRYALVQGATPEDIAAAAKAPTAVQLRASRDLSTMINDEAQSLQQAREAFEREVGQWLDQKRNPPVRASQADQRAHAEAKAEYEAVRSMKESLDRVGGRTDQIYLDQALADADARIKNLEAVGELDSKSKASIAEADEAYKLAEKQAEALDRVEACLRGSL
ncbi:MAG: hypothetical protein Q7U75_10415, partial [Desulfobacterales bacterium]|nr:hypothetical protein [Desulfobacterales bacterium]